MAIMISGHHVHTMQPYITWDPQMPVPCDPRLIIPHPTKQAYYIQQADIIQHSILGLGTDCTSITKVITSNTCEDLAWIAVEYCRNFGHDIIQDIAGDTSFNYKDLICSFFIPRYEKVARWIHDCFPVQGKDEKEIEWRLLLDIVLCSSQEDFQKIEFAFHTIFQQNLQDCLRCCLPKEHWAYLCLAWIRREKTDEGNPDEEAEWLYKAAKGMGTDEAMFIFVMSKAGPKLWEQILIAYNNKFKKKLRETIKSEFAFINEDAFCMAHDANIHPAKTVAFILHESMKWIGTNDKRLIHITSIFRDRYWADVPKFYEKYGCLAKDLKGDTSGHYGKALRILWGVE